MKTIIDQKDNKNLETINKLQLQKVKELVKEYCVSSLGKELVDKLYPSSKLSIVTRKLSENKEARNVIENNTHIPLQGISNVNTILDNIDKGIIAEPVDFIRIQDFLRGCRSIKKFMLDNEFYAPILSSYSLNITECKDIEEEIKYCIKNNNVSSDASKELRKIRRGIEIAEGKIKEKLNKFLTSSVNKKYIQDAVITKRDGRYVIPIKSSYKNEVNGVILDASSKGNTVYIEPASVGRYSTELIRLSSEEAIEVYKILGQLTDMVYSRIKDILLNSQIIAEYDMIFAKAKFSINNKCITPNVNNSGFIKIVKGKHPLLGADAVPLDFEIGKTYKSILITGPNAGGKTVALKTVGLLTLMVQSGMDICASIGTNINIFDNVFVDIGDNQSIENALSTFSSHIKNIAEILSSVNKNSLILLDEIGSGTEPNEGAALAIAILEELYKKGCTTVASTHYGELKNYASIHPHFKNAGMLFDKDTLKPLYKMMIGTSQNSNALFISKKMGIKDNVIRKAKSYIDGVEYDITIKDNCINDIKSYSKEANNEVNIIDYNYGKGDRVKLLEENDYAIVYEPVDKYNNIELLYNDEFIKVNVKRIEPYLNANQLYPEGYDLDSLFTSFKERKLEKDIKRGSKKALKRIQKEMKEMKTKRNSCS